MEVWQIRDLLTRYLTEPEYAKVVPISTGDGSQASMLVTLDDGTSFEVTVAKA